MLCMQTFHSNTKKRILWRIFKRSLLNRVRGCCSISKSSITRDGNLLPAVSSSPRTKVTSMVALPRCSLDSSSDLVSLKISVYGDSNIGKTSFLMKYGGEDNSYHEEIRGINHVDKTLCVDGARICYNIWEVGGQQDQIPAACNQSVAMLFMFDLTSRCTLNSMIQWYRKARKRNQNAIPILIGTKFDEFIQLPLDLQWTIASQARSYAKMMNATLFFSSATYNINVNKIFKFVTAKLFDLDWNLERNLTIGEPIIDF